MKAPAQNGSASINHWIRKAWALQSGVILVGSCEIAETDMSVAPLVMMLPKVV